MGAQKKLDEQQIYKKLKKEFIKDGKLVFVGQFLKMANEKFGDRVAVIAPQKSVNYKELYFRAVQLSKKLKKYGVKKRDKVIVYCPNSIEFFIAYFAVWQIGAVCVPLNIFLHEKELSYVINDCEPTIIFAFSSLKPNLLKAYEQKLLNSLPIILGEDDIDWDFQTPQNFADVYPDFEIDELECDELCLLLYTSGTTGSPKGVMLSSRNVMTNTLQDFTRLKVCGLETERSFAVLPLFHVFAQNVCMWLPVLTGGSVVVVPKIERKLIIDGLKKKPTVFFGFPALYGLLCMIKNAPLDSIKMFVSGADAMPDKIRSYFALIYGRKICAGYGLTEAAPVVALNEENDEQPAHVVGFPCVDMQCDVRDEQGKSLRPYQVGTLWLRGDNIMLGYYKSDAMTAQVLKDGWFNTGDLGYLDKDGRLAVTGRSKDLIIHKGFNIYPQEIENILMSHPLVFKVAVIGQHEGFVGQVPVAFVAVKQKSDDIISDLRSLCAQNLAAYKVPRKFVCLDDLPMSATGKVDKKQLKSII